jgi:hypothetical protein
MWPISVNLDPGLVEDVMGVTAEVLATVDD